MEFDFGIPFRDEMYTQIRLVITFLLFGILKFVEIGKTWGMCNEELI